jgi:hypothetical protein
MISAQKLQARLRDLETVGVPITNYGIILSYLQGPAALDRVLRPFGADRGQAIGAASLSAGC